MNDIVFSEKIRNFFNQLSSKNNGWRRNLIFICIAQFIAMAGMSSCVPFLPLYIRQLGVTNMEEAKLWSGFVFAGPYVLSIIFVPVWGVLGDKYGRKPMVLRAIVGLAIAMFLTGFARNVTELFLMRIFQGAASGFIAAALGFVSAETPKEHSGYAIGLLQSAQAAGNIIGPFFGGILSDFAGFRSVFFIVGGLCVISSLTILFWVKENKAVKIENSDNSLMYNLKYVLKTKELRLLIILIIISQVGIFFTQPIFPYFIENLKAPAKYLSTVTGLLVGIIGVFSIIFAPMWGRRNDRKDYHKTIRVSSVIVGVALAAHIFMPHYLLIFPLRILMGIFIAAIVPTLYSALSKRSPAENLGGIMGIASSAYLFGSLVSFTLCGVVASVIGMIACFIISSIALFIVAAMIGKPEQVAT